MMWFFTTRVGRAIAGAGALLLGLATLVLSFRSKWMNEATDAIHDDMAESYNDTTKEVRNAQTDIPHNPADVLDSLRDFAKRGKGGGNS